MKIRALVLRLLVQVLSVGMVEAAPGKEPMPKRDVVEVPAIGQGLCMANVFQSNMVLQRDKTLNIWGWADAGEKVEVSFGGQTVSATAAADRSWQVTLQPLAANTEPQTMTVKGKSASLSLTNILVGDVWVLGGQSNMEFPISNVDDGELEIVSANFPQIRLLTMPQGKGFESVHSFERLHEWSDWSGRHFRKGDWGVCTPETVREFSAIGYTFGRRIHMASRIPIGLIDASIGGTTVETWTPEEVIRKVDGAETKALLKEWDEKIATYDAQADLKKLQENFDNRVKNLTAKGQKPPDASERPTQVRPGPAADRNRPGYCYASTIKPLTGLAVAGAVWHQGFNNAFNGSAGAKMYYQVFAKMIGAWRETFVDAKMPFCIISLCTAGEPQTWENYLEPTFDAGIYVREAHYKTFTDLLAAGDKTIGFASSFDLRKSWYHPQIKIPAGERAAKWALATRYNLFKGREAQDYWLPPTIQKMEIVGSTIRLTMSTEVKTKDDSDGRMLGFGIAGEDQIFRPATINYLMEPIGKDPKPQANRKVLVLSSPLVSAPIHYRYGWARNPMANIVNNEGVPLHPQRSDDWVLELSPPVLSGMPDEAAKRAAAGQIKKVLQLADTERRIKEAEATIAELKPVLEKARAEEAKKKAGK
jgi:sialate O-acetylesterase